MMLNSLTCRLSALAACVLLAPACRDEPAEDAVRLVELARFLHAEASLVSWLFDATTFEEGVVPAVEPVTRARDLALFLEDEGLTACSSASVLGDQAQVSFLGCPAPYGLGELRGEIEFLFTRFSVGQDVIDTMLLESVGEVELDGHRMALRYYAHASTEPGAFSYRTDVRGTSAGGLAVDFTGDQEKAVDPELCAQGDCYDPRTGRVAFEANNGCVYFVVYESDIIVDGAPWDSIGGQYRKCPHQCPGDCADASCQLNAGSTSILFDGSSTTHPPDEVELDCPD